MHISTQGSLNTGQNNQARQKCQMLPGCERLLKQIMRASVGSIQNNLCVKQALHNILHELKLCAADSRRAHTLASPVFQQILEV